MGESNASEYQLKVSLVLTIKGFCQVDVEDGEFEAMEFDGVQGFLSNANGLMDLLMMEEGELFLGDMLG